MHFSFKSVKWTLSRNSRSDQIGNKLKKANEVNEISNKAHDNAYIHLISWFFNDHFKIECLVEYLHFDEITPIARDVTWLREQFTYVWQ